VTRQNRLKRIPIRRIYFNNSDETSTHDEIVDKVKSIREKMAELAEYSKYFLGVRLTKLDCSAPLPEINDEAIIKSISPENVYNLLKQNRKTKVNSHRQCPAQSYGKKIELLF